MRHHTTLLVALGLKTVAQLNDEVAAMENQRSPTVRSSAQCKGNLRRFGDGEAPQSS
jgi:hypothetical protein